MTTETQPIYIALLAEHRHKIPPTLLAEMWRGRCADCDAPIVAHAPTLQRMQRMFPLGELRIICGPCGRPKRDAEHLEFMLIAPGLAKHFHRG